MAFRRMAMAISIAALALSVASCGGGDGDEGSVAARPDSSVRAQAKPSEGEGPDRTAAGGSGKQGSGDQKGSSKAPEPPVAEPEADNEAGGASPGASAPPPGDSGGNPSSSRFLVQARAVCARGKKELSREVGRYLQDQAPQTRQGDALLELTQNVLLPNMEGQIAELRSLEPPPSSVPGATAFLASWQRTLQSAAAESKSLAGPYGEEALAPVGKLARKAALGACAFE